MCGRFALATDKETLNMLYDLELRSSFDLSPRFNIAPSDQALALRLSPIDGKRELTYLKWGLIPFWAEDPSIGNRMINARSETASEKPSFKNALKRRRLLIPATGFFEWKKTEKGKQPYFIFSRDRQLVSFAGIWEKWEKGPAPLESFTILTTRPNKALAEIHDRMPVIVQKNDFADWLNPKTNIDQLNQIFEPYPDNLLKYHAVTRMVNKPINDFPELIDEIN